MNIIDQDLHLGRVVRKLDVKCTFPIGNRLHLQPLDVKSDEPGACTSLLWIETIQCPQRRSQVSLVQVQFDPECPDRTVHLFREQDSSLNLLFNEGSFETQVNPVTCTILSEPHWLIQGHVDGRISRKVWSISLQTSHLNLHPYWKKLSQVSVVIPLHLWCQKILWLWQEILKGNYNFGN